MKDDNVVAATNEIGRDERSDEAGAANQKNPHELTNTSRATTSRALGPSAPRTSSHRPGIGRRQSRHHAVSPSPSASHQRSSAGFSSRITASGVTPGGIGT